MYRVVTVVVVMILVMVGGGGDGCNLMIGCMWDWWWVG